MNINALVKDWAWRVNDGMPDPKNRNHLEILEATLEAHKYSDDFISAYIDSICNPTGPSDFQQLCVEVGKIIGETDILSEASIYKDKYPIGTEIALNTKGKAWFSKKFSSSPEKLKKVAAQDVPDENSAIKGSGSTTVYLSDGKKTYKITGTPSGIGAMFVLIGSTTGISWGEKTLESAALAGLSFNPQPHLDGLKGGDETIAAESRKNAISDLSSALSNGEMRGGADIKSKLKTCSIPDLILTLELANGTHMFAKAMGCSGWNFIHSKIESFYTAHDSNPKLKLGGSKVPTPDCIIVQGSVSTLIKNIATDGVKFSSNGKCTTDSGDVFYQVSNKKSDSGSQLGRITGLVKQIYGLPSNSDAINMIVEEKVFKYENYSFLLHEGLKDYFKKGLTYLKDKFVSTMNMIKNKLSSLGNTIASTVTSYNGNTKPVDKLIKKLGSGFEKSLTEAKKPKLNAWNFAKACANESAAGNQKRINRLFAEVMSEYNKAISNATTANNGIYATKKTSSPKLYSLTADATGANVVIKYMVNYLSYSTINALFAGQSGNIKDASQVLEDFVELEKEMYFGSSELPIYKVYMSDGKSSAYSYLSSGKEFREEKKSIIKEFANSDVPGVVIESNLQSAGHTNNNLYILQDFTDEGPNYTQISLRSGGEDKLTFGVSGTNKTKWKTLGPKVKK